MSDTDFGGLSSTQPLALTDKEERKKQRKKRVDKLSADSASAANSAQEIKSGQQQTVEGFARLERRVKKGLNDVSDVRLHAEATEAVRRNEDDRLKQSRLSRMQNEAISSSKANASIESKWVDLLAKDIPQELESEIHQQMQDCNAIIKSKDDLILEFQKQLRYKDEEYVNTLRKQAEDIEVLMNTVRNEYSELQSDYDNELTMIEIAYHDERDKMIDDHKSEIDVLFDTRRDAEIRYREIKQKRDAANVHEIEDFISKGADQYSRLNIELETNIQVLKQQFEDIKATYQLNTEKLDYNYRVLTELDIEKNAELRRYKGALTKLKDKLSTVSKEFIRIEKTDKKENAELTEGYRRLTTKYKDLQAKFRHFETADTLKYNEVWSMHEEEVKTLVDQLLRADRVITQQHLGYLWIPPDVTALTSTLDNVRSGNVVWKGEGVVSVVDTLVDDSSTAAFDEEEDTGKDNKRLVQGIRIRAVLRMLAQEVGFLLDPAVVAAIEAMPEKDIELQKAENLLKALGVKTEARMAVLLKYFFRDETPVNQLGGPTALEAEEEKEQKVKPTDELLLFNTPEEIMELRSMISGEDVVAAVKTFIDDVSDGSAVGRGTVDETSKGTEDANRIRQRRLAGMKLYWSYLSQIVGDESIGVWKQLETDNFRMKDALTNRAKCIEYVDMATKRNADMKALLNQYLGDEKNTLFQVPPAQTMRVRVPSISNTKKTKTLMTSSPDGKDSQRQVMKQSDAMKEKVRMSRSK